MWLRFAFQHKSSNNQNGSKRLICKKNTHFRGHSGELSQVPPGNLHNTVIKAGLKTCSGWSSNRVLQQWQGMTQSQLGSYISQRVASSLTGKGRWSWQAGIHFNYIVLKILKRVGHLNNDTLYNISCMLRNPAHLIIRFNMLESKFSLIFKLNVSYNEIFTRSMVLNFSVFHLECQFFNQWFSRNVSITFKFKHPGSL